MHRIWSIPDIRYQPAETVRFGAECSGVGEASSRAGRPCVCVPRIYGAGSHQPMARPPGSLPPLEAHACRDLALRRNIRKRLLCVSSPTVSSSSRQRLVADWTRTRVASRPRLGRCTISRIKVRTLRISGDDLGHSRVFRYFHVQHECHGVIFPKYEPKILSTLRQTLASKVNSVAFKNYAW